MKGDTPLKEDFVHNVATAASTLQVTPKVCIDLSSHSGTSNNRYHDCMMSQICFIEKHSDYISYQCTLP